MLRMPDVGQIIDSVVKIADKRKTKPATVALAWSLSNPLVTSPIVGCSKTQYIDDAVRATALKLTPEEIREIEKPYRAKPTVGFTDPTRGRSRM